MSLLVDMPGEYPRRHGKLHPPLSSNKLNSLVLTPSDVRVGKGVSVGKGWVGVWVSVGGIDGNKMVGVGVNISVADGEPV